MKHKVILHTGIAEGVNTPVVHQELRELSEQFRKFILITGRFPNRDQRRRMTANENSQPRHTNRALTPGRKRFRMLKMFSALIPAKALANLKAMGSSLRKIFRRKATN